MVRVCTGTTLQWYELTLVRVDALTCFRKFPAPPVQLISLPFSYIPLLLIMFLPPFELHAS